MDFYQMQYVLALAKYRNFTLAAESCYISQSSLSQQISNLEKELGIRLFHRTTRSIQITEAGETFVKLAGEVVSNVDLMRQVMSTYSGFLRGTINIGAITALEKINFSSLITEFYTCYPGLNLNIYQGESASLLESLEKRTIDVAFVAQPHAIGYPNLTFQLMGTDVYDLILSDSHPLADQKVIDMAQLKDERFIFHHPNQTVSSLCLQACSDAGFTPHVTCRVAASSIALSLVRAGLGICFLPAEEVAYYRMRGIRRKKLLKPIQKRIVMATLNKGEPSHLVSNFVSFFQNRIYKKDKQ